MIVTLGESMIDFIGSEAFLGGCPLNVSIATSRLGSNVAYIGKISSDEYGIRILNKLIEEIIFFDPSICASPLPTSYSRATVGAGGDVSYEFNFTDTASMSVTREEILEGFKMIVDLDYVFIGSVGLTLDPSATEIEGVVDTLAPEVILFLDPNVRPVLVGDWDAYRSRIERILHRADVTRFSSEDLKALYPDLDEEQAVGRIFSLGARNLIITRGSEGSSWFVDGKAVCSCPSGKVKVSDTIGCGDTFDGAILHSLEKLGYHKTRTLTVEEIGRILKLATAASTVNCTRAGCNPPRLEELNLEC